jgi:hypothetical protein
VIEIFARLLQPSPDVEHVLMVLSCLQAYAQKLGREILDAWDYTLLDLPITFT